MKYGSIPGVGDRVSRLVLGSLVLSSERIEAARALLDQFVAAGGTAIDTAHVYGRGASERGLGAWLGERGRRSDLTIITKGAHHAPDGTQRVTPEAITADLTESMERLGIDRVDLFLLHRDDPSKPVGPIMECLHGHVEAGRIGAFGASNWTTERIDEANRYAAEHGLRPFVASSPNLALAVTNEPMWPNCVSVAGDQAALAWYRERQFPLLAWSSQAAGFFSGRFAPEVRENEAMVRVYYRPDNWERLERARSLAREKGCSPVQIALAWVLQQPFPTFALIGPRAPEELEDSLRALDLELSPDEARWLNLEE